MGKLHRSAQGKLIDIETIRLKNESVPAIGNMRVNARGDQLGPGGKVIKTREMVMDEHYHAQPAENLNVPTSGKIPTRTPRKPSAPIPTSSKKPLPEVNFKPDLAVPDTIVETPVPTTEPELKGGLAAAVARAKKKKTKEAKDTK